MVLTEIRPARARTEEAVIALRGLRVSYGGIEAVRGVDLTIDRNETFGLLGPNGAGKTTILSCIEGLRRPDGGSVRVLGRDVTQDVGAIKERIGVSLQSTALFPTLTASNCSKSTPRCTIASPVARRWDDCWRVLTSRTRPRRGRRSYRAGSSSGSRWRSRSLTNPNW